ncbi:MAG: SDR family oxidoreductase [Coriobacteriales bacterium]|jgi:NAD(P)-dependent dehydrogenase (short-subunit alcohol dehydrogenase family)
MNQEKQVVVLVGAGGIGKAIARRVAFGKKLLITGLTQEETDASVKELQSSGFDVEGIPCDLSKRADIEAVAARAQELGPVENVICAGGVSPSQAPIETILAVDLYGTSVLLEEFGKIIAPGGSAVVVSSQSGHRLPALSPEENMLLATTPTEELLGLPMLQPETIGTTLRAYQYAKRTNVLRCAYEATRWGRRGARVNSVSPGIVITPLAFDEINGPRGEGYRTMIEKMPAGRAATTDEVAALCEFLLGPSAAFITGTDVLADGGCTAAYWYGDLRYLQDGWAQS